MATNDRKRIVFIRIHSHYSFHSHIRIGISIFVPDCNFFANFYVGDNYFFTKIEKKIFNFQFYNFQKTL